MKATRAQAKQALAMEDTSDRLARVEEKLDRILELLEKPAEKKPAPKPKAKPEE